MNTKDVFYYSKYNKILLSCFDDTMLSQSTYERNKCVGKHTIYALMFLAMLNMESAVRRKDDPVARDTDHELEMVNAYMYM